MKSWIKAFLNFVFPPKCPLCGIFLTAEEEHLFFCKECFGDINFITAPFCPRCGLPYPANFPLLSPPCEGGGHLCGQCNLNKRTFEKARAIAYYDGTLLKSIQQFKYNDRFAFIRPLGKLLGDYLMALEDGFSYGLIIPVPLHKKRLRERGFNQSSLLAKVVAKRTSIPLDVSSLRRVRWTEPQTNLSGKEREKNVKGAFKVVKRDRVEGKKILLIDDVFTTGSTVNECAKALLRVGAKGVDILTLARVAQG